MSQLLHNLNNVINAGPDMILVAGDATTTLAASLISFYHHISLGHVEAGLRTYERYSPFPDEMHRRLTDNLADLYLRQRQVPAIIYCKSTIRQNESMLLEILQLIA